MKVDFLQNKKQSNKKFDHKDQTISWFKPKSKINTNPKQKKRNIKQFFSLFKNIKFKEKKSQNSILIKNRTESNGLQKNHIIKQKTDFSLIKNKKILKSAKSKQKEKIFTKQEINKNKINISLDRNIRTKKIFVNKNKFFLDLWQKIKKNLNFFSEPQNSAKLNMESETNNNLLSHPKHIKQEADIIQTNLLNEEDYYSFDWQNRFLIIVLVVFLGTGILLGTYWGMDYYLSLRTETEPVVKVDYSVLNSQLKQLQEKTKAAQNLQAKIAVVNKLINQHIYWSNFFSCLESNTLANIYFDNFAGGLQGSYSLNGHTDDLQAIEKQVEQFLKDKYILSASINSLSLPKQDEQHALNSFTINFSVDKKIFYKDYKVK